MKKLITELRRRKVFRSSGYYIALAVAAIEAANNILPVFGAPDWIYEAITIGAIALFPVVVAAAWHFDFTSEGIISDKEASAKAAAEPADVTSVRKKDFAVIAVLTVALGFSVYMNLTRGPAEPEAQPEPVSILIADFDNSTGDPIFAGTLEQSLTLGLEGASFITAFPREDARRVAAKMELGEALDAKSALLVAVREGIKLVVNGLIHPDGSGYRMEVSVLASETSEEVARHSLDVKDRASVLVAISTLANEIRESLGDVSITDAADTVSSSSLEAIHAYMEGKKATQAGQHELAIENYRKAVEIDPKLARAYGGWAIAAGVLGQQDVAKEQWEKCLGLIDTMTEREKLRTLGVYYITVTENAAMAIETYQTLSQRYPSDGSAYNALAVAYFMTQDFEKAMEAGKEVLELNPRPPMFRANYALYAMYAGKHEIAAEAAQALVADHPGYYVGYLPLAVAAAAMGKAEEAEGHYLQMATQGDAAEALGNMGLGDLELFKGNAREAETLLTSGIEQDLGRSNNASASAKLILRARARRLLGNTGGSKEDLAQAVTLGPRSGQLGLIGLEYVRLGDLDKAGEISGLLSRSVTPRARAWNLLVKGETKLSKGELGPALEDFSSALELSDIWMARLARGRAYLAAEHYPEALADLELCQQRIGETSALLLDDRPTLNYGTELPYWLALAQSGLGIKDAATTNFQAFLANRGELDDPLTEDARRRLATP